MIHYFIINPSAGKDSPERLIPAIESACVDMGVEYRIHCTESKEEGIGFVRKVTSEGQPVRLYAAGGDGTLNDVLNGIVDFENTELGSIPCGTGNDFVKSLAKHRENMLRFEKQLTAPSRRVDCLSVGDRLCINICNIGVDSNAAFYMQQIKRYPLINKLSYYLGLGRAMCQRLGTQMHIEFDDGTVVERSLVLAVFGNGCYYGGAFKAAPEAKVDDGLIDICLIDEVNIVRFLKLVGNYKKGLHLADPNMKDILCYRTATAATVSADKPLRICYDGELVESKQVKISILPKKIRFIVPENE